MINIVYCVECGDAYDIGTNYEKCPNCRNKKDGEDNGC